MRNEQIIMENIFMGTLIAMSQTSGYKTPDELVERAADIARAARLYMLEHSLDFGGREGSDEHSY